MTTDVEILKQQACAVVDLMATELIEISHDIHDHPELNFQEHYAAERLARAATKHGLDTTIGAYGVATGFAAEHGNGPTVAIVCEYDALPGIGHGCGHNVIAAAGIGAALAATAVCDSAGGSVRLLGTPAEEGGGGKISMGRNGAFDGLAVAMMVHPADADLSTIDAIAIQQLLVEYTGRASHAAAAPQYGRNALDAAVMGYIGVAALRQHIAPTERVHGIFLTAGDKPNIVPRESSMDWYVRSDTIATLQPLKSRVLACLEAGALSCGCTMTHQWDDRPYADMLTNGPLVASYVTNSAMLGRIVQDPRECGHAVVGSTDMGNVSHLVPSIHPMIAIAPQGTAIHTEDFATYARSHSADKAILDAAKAMVMTAIDFWTSAQRQALVAEVFSRENSSTNVL
ncbi:MAG: M20 family peptidase [Ilumatobacteraceae bacterium]|nr:M20 family peptidase [Ilumatobacteraceae bacterium]